MEKYEVKILTMEKKQESLQSQLDVAMDEVKRAKEDAKRSLWDLERGIGRDYTTKADQERLLDTFKQFLKSNTKALKGLVLQQQEANQDTVHELVQMFQRFIKMQNEQMGDFFSVVGSGRRLISADDESNVLAHRRRRTESDVVSDRDEDTGLRRPLREDHSSRHHKRRRHHDTDSEASSLDTSDSSASKPKHYNDKSHQSTKKNEKKYIQDILQESGETDEFDDIFRGHMNDIQNQDPFGPTLFNPLQAGEDEFAETFVGGDVQQVTTTTTTTEVDQRTEDEISTQKLTQQFKNSLQKDDNLKSSNLMSFFDKYANDPASVQNPQPTPDSKVSHTSWEVNEEVKDSVSQILESVKQEHGSEQEKLEQGSIPAKEDTTSTDNTTTEHPETTTASAFDQHDFDRDAAFHARLQSYQQSGEFDQIKARLGGSEDMTLLRVKANYFQQNVDPKFDLEQYCREKGIEMPTQVLPQTPRKAQQDTSTSSSTKKRKPRPKPWEKKSKKEDNTEES